MKKEIEIGILKTNPDNPRIIKDDKFIKLQKSIKELSGFLELRPIIVDEDMVVLGGNMRLKAAESVGKKEVWIDIFTKDMSDKMNEEAIKQGRKQKTYLEYCEEIIIRDNISSGEWEWVALTQNFNTNDLIEWGLDVWSNDDLLEVDEINNNQPEKPSMTHDDYSAFEIIMLHDNKLKLLSVLNNIKTKLSLEKQEEALMELVLNYDRK